MAGIREGQGQLVFGLDIGTRSIVGTVGYLNGNKFHVLAQRFKEHETRAMLDGQIHDIVKVGQTISEVKEQLEEDLNRNLTEVCIAAAGRVLRTVTTYVEETFEAEKEIVDEDIYNLSTLGVERAYEEFQSNNDTELKFYCVGYTPMRYYMNGYQIGNLEAHKAKTIGADLIATFLPDDVVDGLYKAVELAGLHVANMTLEPIAAIQVAIPERFRMLNMALVDVGAGTSDISITKEGTITAYGMIPTAGDSLTEVIVQSYLVDFETAEHIKRSAGTAENIEYTDIMGLPQTISAADVRKLLEEPVENMTRMVSDCIKELNGDKAVSAVFVVGGGGMIPGYTDKLAAHLGIAKERVAIRGQEVMQNIAFEQENAQKDAMMVTPVGICLSYYEQSNNFIFIVFNGERLKLYDNGRLSVADAAMQVSFPNEDLFPKRGKALTFTVNGKSKMVRGSQGEAAVITINGDVADMYAQIQSGDIIKVSASTEGEPADQELGKLSEFSEQLHIFMEGKKIDLPKTAEVNGVRENEYYHIKEGDVINIHNYYTVQEIAGILDVPLGGDIRVNDAPAKADTRVYENFTVSFKMDGSTFSYEDLPDADPEEENMGKQAEQNQGANAAQGQAANIAQNPQNLQGTGQMPDNAGSGISVMVNDRPVVLTGKKSYVFVDVFDHINFDLNKSDGREIVTNLNGRRAEYMEELHEGDVIQIYWRED
ncbi:MAG: rod shape-determining protein [Bacteroidales bacterium]|nr:rod shape-determining protein [Lachnoclostridium sp.]MCM1385679.1 rod shape-determining protein [Lachnoclostridium sp.]MCM1463853.1 rod shape-determining protein [Bacteroidales bacterium]